MKKFIFDIITSTYSLFSNPIYNYIAMAIVGSIAFAVAWNLVKRIGARGELGSILHWTIRLIAFVLIWFIFSIIINVILFIKEHFVLISICLTAVIVLYVLSRYAKKHPDSSLNKRVF